MNKTEFQIPSNLPDTAEALWDYFEKTGSVQVYLRYAKKIEEFQAPANLLLPS